MPIANTPCAPRVPLTCYSPQHPRIVRAISGLRSAVCQTEDGPHLQLATSAVWDTALLAYALQRSGMAADHPMIQRAIAYLLGKQHTKSGDWKMRNPQASPGGWPAFEKHTDSPLIRHLPIEGSDTASTDPSAADLTGRTLEFLGTYAGLRQTDPQVQKAVRWLLRQQRADGSWHGRWGIAFLYGTWAALTGMTAVGVPADSPVVQKAASWLIRTQNADGGWGESCASDAKQSYVALGASTPSQTAWAVDALVSVFPEPIPAVERGVQYLLCSGRAHDWTASYPTGGGRPGGIYFAYHSYRRIWPLLALSHYRRKYGQHRL